MNSYKPHARTELRIFYAVVLVLALFGQSSGASSWLIPKDANEAQMFLYWLLVFAFVAVLELGAVVLLRRAETQRRAGQRAWIAILTAIALALGAAALSWAGHWGPETHERIQACAFAGIPHSSGSSSGRSWPTSASTPTLPSIGLCAPP